MENNTVDLTGKFAEQQKAAKQAADLAAARKPAAHSARPLPSARKPIRKSRAEEIDQIYDSRKPEIDEDLRRIDQPALKKVQSQGAYKKPAFILALALLAVFSYFYFIQDKSQGKNIPAAPGSSGWYSVKLINGEVYYGQIADLASDPVVVENVYYNYDQLNGDKAASGTSQTGGNLRLVKRGKELHGPDGSLRVVRAQVVYMEPMKEDSKVLKAILEYEK